jgi:hypothetical protein
MSLRERTHPGLGIIEPCLCPPPPDPKVMWWQDRLTPVWKRLGGGCHLNRAIGTLIEEAGFRFDRLETGYMRGPKPMTFMYEGSARP